MVSPHRGCAAAMVPRLTWADVAGGIAAIRLPLDRLFSPAIRSSYQLSGLAVWEQLSSPVGWEQLSGPVV